jgi:hypothetical protein
MLSLILWLPFIGFLGGSFCGRHMGRGIVFFTTVHVLVTFCVGFFLLCVNFTQNKKQKTSNNNEKYYQTSIFDRWNGIEIKKIFKNKIYPGEIKGYDSHYKLFKIKYEDGDEEELSFNETISCIELAFQ